MAKKFSKKYTDIVSRINLFSEEIDCNEEEIKELQGAIDDLYVRLDALTDEEKYEVS